MPNSNYYRTWYVGNVFYVSGTFNNLYLISRFTSDLYNPHLLNLEQLCLRLIVLV